MIQQKKRLTEDELANQVKKVVGILENADVPADLRRAAFESVWSSLSGQVTPAAIGRGRVPPQMQELEGLDGLASKLGVEVALVNEVFEQNDDGTFNVQVPTSKLASTKAAATKELALLVCAARQYGPEEWTNADHIRTVCQHYGKFDSANNASIMAEGDAYWMISGSGRSRKYRLRKKGWEEAGILIRKIVSE